MAMAWKRIAQQITSKIPADISGKPRISIKSANHLSAAIAGVRKPIARMVPGTA
jgi:hypothetical protein